VPAHSFTSGKDAWAASRVARALALHGYAVPRFDFTGLGGSDGEFANTNFSSNVGDLVAAAEYLRGEHRAPSLLVGHSLGGAAVIAAAEHIPETRAVATLAAPADTEHLLHLLAGKREDIESTGEAVVNLASREFRIRRQFLDDVAGQPQAERVRRLDAALLVMHSPVDGLVGIENAAEIYGNARHPKSFVSLDDADHLLTRAEDAEYAAGILAAWADRYVDQPAEEDEREAGSAAPAPEGGGVTVAERGAGAYGQRVGVRDHVLSVDEPAPTGEDSGPSPYDLVLAGLGSCTSITLRMYADRKGWPLERVAVSLRHSRIHAEDCESCETETGHLDRVDRTIHLEGPLDEEQRARLLEIADRCPVHRTLEAEVHVVTTEDR
jgi:putative redox protein